jgi:asparagine synthase (glutamine-hydrolysing)
MVRSAGTERDGLVTEGAGGSSDGWLEPFAAIIADSPYRPGSLEHQQHIDLRTFLADDILVKTDRASMAVSLEARVPYLDHELVEFAFRLPAGVKLRGLTGKWILRRAFRGRLPESTLRRRKSGFSVPIAAWLRHELRPVARDLLQAGRLRRQGLFHPAPVERLLDEHEAATADHGRALWALLMFQLWHDRFATPAVAAPGAVRAAASAREGTTR